ncbi:MAG: cyclic nucleotide-binding domain-containing protein [Rhodobacteraceae bacterium]|nr:cyclic nucleotide-binding domain-containing protein [Paracoccaceae bacterium]
MVHLVQFPQKTVQDLAPLHRLGWLSHQSPELRDWFVANGRWRTYSAGEIIYLHGDSPDGMYGLGSGAIDVYFAPADEDPVLVHRAETGFWIGESALLAHNQRIISLSAATECRVFRVPAPALRSLLSSAPQHWPAFYELTHANCLLALTLLSEALTLTPLARLARLMLRLSAGGPEIVANQDDLGRLLGLTRSSLRRSLSRLAATGAITTGYGRISIVDHERLLSVSNAS